MHLRRMIRFCNPVLRFHPDSLPQVFQHIRVPERQLLPYPCLRPSRTAPGRNSRGATARYAEYADAANATADVPAAGSADAAPQALQVPRAV